MFFSIEPSNGVAIYDQIVRQVMFAVAGGAVRPGERIASVRELAKQLAVNPNTVARAYRELLSAGVLQTVRGAGMEVAEGAAAPCRKQRTDLVRQRINSVLLEAKRSGMEQEAVRQIIDRELGRLWKEGDRQ